MSYGQRYALILAATVAVASAYWSAINIAYGLGEPWDTPDYMTIWYPLSLALAAMLGFLFEDEAWQLGAIVVLIQLPLMLLWGSGMGPLIGLGIMMLLVMSLPAILAARIGAAIKRRIKGWRSVS